MNFVPLDVIPLWLFFILATAVCVAAVEFGYRFGKSRHILSVKEKEEPVAAMVAALLGLVAFMLAFTFSMAASRFDARRQAVMEEANVIGTTYLRTRFLPEPERSECADLLRQYTILRVDAIPKHKVTELLQQSEEIHEKLWTRAVTVADRSPTSIPTGLFLQSLNETIDYHGKRVYVGLESRIPLTIWIALFIITLLGMISIGYQSGLAGTPRSPEILVLAVAFAGVLLLNVDLDRAHEGLLRVSQQPMIDVLRTMPEPK